MHYIKVHADTHEDIEEAARAANAKSCQSYPFNGRVVGVILLEVLSERQKLRNHPKVDILPHHSSPTDISQHANKLNLPKAKTARDIHEAVFQVHDLDYFDPDL